MNRHGAIVSRWSACASFACILLACSKAPSDAAVADAAPRANAAEAVADASGTLEQDDLGTIGKAPSAVPAVPFAPVVDAQRCSAGEVTVTLGAVGSDKGQPSIPIVVTNGSASACSLDGSLTAEFLPALGKQYNSGATYPLPQSGNRVRNLVLPPGKSAHTELTFLLVADGVATDGLAITLPGDRARAATLAWTQGPVMDHSAATHPGNYVSYLVAGAAGGGPAPAAHAIAATSATP